MPKCNLRKFLKNSCGQAKATYMPSDMALVSATSACPRNAVSKAPSQGCPASTAAAQRPLSSCRGKGACKAAPTSLATGCYSPSRIMPPRVHGRPPVSNISLSFLGACDFNCERAFADATIPDRAPLSSSAQGRSMPLQHAAPFSRSIPPSPRRPWPASCSRISPSPPLPGDAAPRR